MAENNHNFKKIKYILAVDKALNTLGNKRFEKIQKSGLRFQELWEMPGAKIRTILGQEEFVEKLIKERAATDPDLLVEDLKKSGIKAVTILDDKYPKPLREIFSPPVVLYYKGNIDILSAPGIAVVGSRKITPYGKNATEKVVSGLAQAGYVVVSGMALGIDTFVHETTLCEQGKTVAVLGCGLDKPYPASNTNLFKRIIDSGGVVISEYMPGKPPLRQHFPARNRIISGLSQGILVVEANIRSGALITARDALEQNRDVFAIPGPIFGESSSGTNSLLKMGATLVTDAGDIMEYYGHKAPKKYVSRPSNKVEEAIFGILKAGEKHIDEIIMNVSDHESQLIISTLTLMEIKGKVKNLGGMVYILN